MSPLPSPPMPNIVILGTAHPAATAHEHARPRGDDLADSPILPQLSEALNAHFNRDEIIDLAFDLGLDHEKWPDKGKPGLIRELILKAGWRTSFKAKPAQTLSPSSCNSAQHIGYTWAKFRAARLNCSNI